MKPARVKSPVVTPEIDLIDYDLDWRHRLAADMAAIKPKGKARDESGADPVVEGWVLFLKREKTLPVEEYAIFKTALGWTKSKMAEVLKPRLLTNQSYEEIARVLGLDPETVALFEKSFFNVRTDRGALRPLPLLHKRFMGADGVVDPDIGAALRAGIFGLDAALGMPAAGEDGKRNALREAEQIRAMASQQLAARMLRGDLSSRELIAIQQIAADVATTCGESEGYYEGEYKRVMKYLLDFNMPERVPVEAYAPHIETATAAAMSNRAAQATLDAHGEKVHRNHDPLRDYLQTESHKRDMEAVLVPDGIPCVTS